MSTFWNVLYFVFLLELVLQIEDLPSALHHAILSGMPMTLWLIWVIM